MVFSSRIRRFAAAFGVAAIGFVQVAMAAHACVARTLAGPAPSEQAVYAAEHEGAPCNRVETVRVNHCAQHCESVQQSLDHHQPSFSMPVLVAMYEVDPLDRLAAVQSNERYSQALLARSTAPPLAVQNCCFRT